MGEIADAMIGGDLCEMCGVALPGNGDGYPRYCSQECADDRGADSSQVVTEEEWDEFYDAIDKLYPEDISEERE